MGRDIDQYIGESAFSTNTADRYRRALNKINSDVEIKSLTGTEFRTWLDSQHWSSATRWVAFNAVRGYIRWRYGKGHPALALKIKRGHSPPQRVLKLDQVTDLLCSFDTSRPKGRRDLAICGLFLDAGLRGSEICRLELKFVNLDNNSLQVIVKGSQWSFRSFSDHTAAWLVAWLGDRVEREVSQIFISLGGNTPGKALTTRGLRIAVAGWGRAAGIGELSPHDLRRTFASVTTQLGAPEDIVMKGGGWRNHEVFRLYTIGVDSSDLAPWFPTKAAMNVDPRTKG